MWGSVEGFLNEPDAIGKVLSIPESDSSIKTVAIGQPAKPQELSPSIPGPFLKTLIKNEQETVKSLLKTASRIGPVAQLVSDKESAYDAAFLNSTPAKLPVGSSTLQGFTFILFFGSYIVFTIVVTILMNIITQDGFKAGMTFLTLFILGPILIALIKRFG